MYAISRALKPKIIIETGVSHGVGSCVLSKSLILNKIDGFPGKYFGTEIDTIVTDLILELSTWMVLFFGF